MRDKLAIHQFVLFGVLVLLIIFKILVKSFVLDLYTLWWLLGAVVGFLFVFTDRFVYSFLVKPEEALGLRLKELFGTGKVIQGIVTLLNERHEQKELIMRSFLFVVVWIVLAILTVTSVSAPFARGLLLGIGIHLVFDLLYDFNFNQERFNLWFWQIKREVSSEEKRWFVLLVGAIFSILAFNF